MNGIDEQEKLSDHLPGQAASHEIPELSGDVLQQQERRERRQREHERPDVLLQDVLADYFHSRIRRSCERGTSSIPQGCTAVPGLYIPLSTRSIQGFTRCYQSVNIRLGSRTAGCRRVPTPPLGFGATLPLRDAFSRCPRPRCPVPALLHAQTPPRDTQRAAEHAVRPAGPPRPPSRGEGGTGPKPPLQLARGGSDQLVVGLQRRISLSKPDSALRAQERGHHRRPISRQRRLRRADASSTRRTSSRSTTRASRARASAAWTSATSALRRPSSRFLTSSLPSGNYGAQAIAQFGRLQFKAIFAQQTGNIVQSHRYLVDPRARQITERDVEDRAIEPRRFFFTARSGAVPRISEYRYSQPLTARRACAGRCRIRCDRAECCSTACSSGRSLRTRMVRSSSCRAWAAAVIKRTICSARAWTITWIAPCSGSPWRAS